MRKEDRAGIELTIIFHLVAVIILLIFGIGSELREENSFVLDFTKEEQILKEKEKEEFRSNVNDRLEEKIALANKNNPIRNVAVSSVLRDDRNSDKEARQLYEEAAKLADNLKKGFKSDIEEDARDERVDINKTDTGKKVEYTGPSVLSWTLDGRKASHLPIPAYRCIGSGRVSILISVNQQGSVVSAKVNEVESSEDECLRNFAIRAARLSKFSASPKAPVRQGGEIVYEFIAQ